MEERYSPNDRVGEVHHQVDTSLDRDIYRIQPFWIYEAGAVLGIDEKVNLMDVEWVNFMRGIHDSPVVKRPDGDTRHRRIRRAIFLAIDVEAAFVFSEGDNKVGRAIFNPHNQLWRQRFVNRWSGVH